MHACNLSQCSRDFGNKGDISGLINRKRQTFGLQADRNNMLFHSALKIL